MENDTRQAPGVDDLLARGQYLQAIELLTSLNRAAPDPDLEIRLARLRHDVWPMVDQPEPEGPWPPEIDDLFPPDTLLPQVEFADLTADLLTSGIAHHGAIHVRDLFDESAVALLRDDIDHTMDAVSGLGQGAKLGDRPEWLTPLDITDYGVEGLDRMWVLQSGTVWAPDSPRTMFDILEAMEAAGLVDLLTQHFGHRPVLSATKFAMRRVPPDAMGGWHQDGYVLGAETRTLNVWIALSPCGSVAPGLDVLPRRLDHFVETAVEPPLDFIVSPDVVQSLAEGAPIVRPEFEAGDALIFDQYLLHQTGWGEGLTAARFGLECWFFCPSTYPQKLPPIVI